MIIVDVADSFGGSLDAIEVFMFVQDEGAAERRSDQLEDQIIDLIERLEERPKIGRRADFYAVTLNASQAWLQKLEPLAAHALMLEIRASVLSSSRPVPVFRLARDPALSIRHEQEAKYGSDAV